MANVIELVQAGAQSATYYIKTPNDPTPSFSILDWQKLPNGKLKDLLTGIYVDSEGNPDAAAFARAYAKAGALFRWTTMIFPVEGSGTFLLVGPFDSPNLPVGSVFFASEGFGVIPSALHFETSYSASE